MMTVKTTAIVSVITTCDDDSEDNGDSVSDNDM